MDRRMDGRMVTAQLGKSEKPTASIAFSAHLNNFPAGLSRHQSARRVGTQRAALVSPGGSLSLHTADGHQHLQQVVSAGHHSIAPDQLVCSSCQNEFFL
jgi:hypothetical protein